MWMLLDLLIVKTVEIALEKTLSQVKPSLCMLHIQKHVIVKNQQQHFYKKKQKM